MKTLRRVLFRDLGLLIAVVVAAVTVLAWTGMTRLAREQARSRLDTELHQVDQDLRFRFAELEQSGALLAKWWSTGILAPDREEEAWRLLVPLFESGDVVTGVNLVRVDGQGFGIGRLGKGWGGRGIHQVDGTWVSGALFGAAQEASQKDPGTIRPAQDFRERPWYVLGRSLTEGRWTEPYHYVGRYAGVPGISFVQPVLDPQGVLLGVISIDVRLESVTRTLREARRSAQTMVMAVDPQGRVMVPPGEGPFQEAGPREGLFLQEVRTDLFPLAHRLLEAYKAGMDPGFQGLAVKVGGQGYFGRLARFGGTRGLDWFLIMAIPDEAYLADPRRRGLLVAGLAASLTALLAWQALRLGHRFADPLMKLEVAAGHLGQQGPLDLPKSSIREIRGLATAIEVAHRGQQERELLHEQLRQSQKLETVGTLAGGIAHDVNNQLTAILGQIELGLERAKVDPEGRRHFEVACQAAHRCAQTTKALLSFSRPAPPEPEPVDLNQVVRESFLLLDRVVGTGIQLTSDLAEDLPLVLGDKVQLEQVVVNLVVNAKDALPAGGTILVGTSLQDDQIALTVQDNGVGMTPEVLGKIFEPFFTTKAIGKGTGLGLSMVHGIVQGHGGTIAVASAWGEGSTFTVRLHPAGAPHARTQELPAEAPPGRLDGRTILVAEDEEAIRELMAEGLTLRGAEVVTAASGDEAFARFQERAFDLLISDQLMPGLTGLELLDQVRALAPALPVILASGRGLEGMEDRLADDPRLRLLPKPYTLHRLAQVADELLRS